MLRKTMALFILLLLASSLVVGMEKNVSESLVLVSSDKQKRVVDRNIIGKLSPVIASIADDKHIEQGEISFNEIDGATLNFIINAAGHLASCEYQFIKESGDCTSYYPLKKVKKSLKKTAKESTGALVKLLCASDLLEIKPLVEFASYCIAKKIDTKETLGKHLKHYDLSKNLELKITYYKDLVEKGWPCRTVFDVITPTGDKISTTLSDQDITDLEGLDYVPMLAHATYLSLSGNLVSSVPADLFVAARSLKTLSFHNNCITQLHHRSMKGLDALETLDLSHNDLTQVPTNALSLLTKLRDLNLDSNKIKVLSNYAFTSLTNLRILRLNHNHVNTIQPHAFQGLDSVEHVSITGNNLHSVDPNVFEYIKSAEITLQ